MKKTIPKPHMSAHRAASILQKFMRTKTMKSTKRNVLFTKWIKDPISKREFNVKFQTFKQQ